MKRIPIKLVTVGSLSSLILVALSSAAAAQVAVGNGEPSTAGVVQTNPDNRVFPHDSATLQEGIPSNSQAALAGHDDQLVHPASPQTTVAPAPAPLTFSDRARIYFHSITNPLSILPPLVTSGIDQARNAPQEWGPGAEGFGRRFGSAYGRAFISRTIAFGVAAIDHEDPRREPSAAHGAWPRTRDAIVGTFVSRRTDRTRMPAYSRFIGNYGAAFIANAWYPDREATTGNALKRGSRAMLSSAGWRIFEEFWPDIRRKIRKV